MHRHQWNTFARYGLIIGLVVTGLISLTARAADPIETGFFSDEAIYGYDTVAYFTENKAMKGKESFRFEWRGAVWLFATEEHKAMFISAPEKYAPQYGGYCAYAMAQGKLAGIDEDAFTLHDGKLYLNYSKSVMEDWRADMQGYITKADKIYPAKVDL